MSARVQVYVGVSVNPAAGQHVCLCCLLCDWCACWLGVGHCTPLPGCVSAQQVLSDGAPPKESLRGCNPVPAVCVCGVCACVAVIGLSLCDWCEVVLVVAECEPQSVCDSMRFMGTAMSAPVCAHVAMCPCAFECFLCVCLHGVMCGCLYVVHRVFHCLTVLQFCISISVCVSACLCVFVSVCINVSEYLCVCASVCVFLSLCASVSVCSMSVCASASVCTCMQCLHDCVAERLDVQAGSLFVPVSQATPGVHSSPPAHSQVYLEAGLRIRGRCKTPHSTRSLAGHWAAWSGPSWAYSGPGHPQSAPHLCHPTLSGGLASKWVRGQCSRCVECSLPGSL